MCIYIYTQYTNEGMFNLPKFVYHISPFCWRACCALHCLLSTSSFLLLFWYLFLQRRCIALKKTQVAAYITWKFAVWQTVSKCWESLGIEQPLLAKQEIWFQVTTATDWFDGSTATGRDSEPYVCALKTHAINEPTAPVAVCFNLFSGGNTF